MWHFHSTTDIDKNVSGNNHKTKIEENSRDSIEMVRIVIQISKRKKTKARRQVAESTRKNPHSEWEDGKCIELVLLAVRRRIFCLSSREYSVACYSSSLPSHADHRPSAASLCMSIVILLLLLLCLLLCFRVGGRYGAQFPRSFSVLSAALKPNAQTHKRAMFGCFLDAKVTAAPMNSCAALR